MPYYNCRQQYGLPNQTCIVTPIGNPVCRNGLGGLTHSLDEIEQIVNIVNFTARLINVVFDLSKFIFMIRIGQI